MKACKDCEFCKAHWLSSILDYSQYARCSHPDAQRFSETIDPVSGKVSRITEMPYCAIVRKHECGVNGKWFKTKKNTKPLTQG